MYLSSFPFFCGLHLTSAQFVYLTGSGLSSYNISYSTYRYPGTVYSLFIRNINVEGFYLRSLSLVSLWLICVIISKLSVESGMLRVLNKHWHPQMGPSWTTSHPAEVQTAWLSKCPTQAFLLLFGLSSPCCTPGRLPGRLSAWLLKSSPATKQLSITKHTQNTQLLDKMEMYPHLHTGSCTQMYYTHICRLHLVPILYTWGMHMHMHTLDTSAYHMCLLCPDEEWERETD